MTPEFWAIIGVGVALLTLGWFAFNSLRGDINNIDRRLAGLEATVALIVQGLRIEIKGSN